MKVEVFPKPILQSFVSTLNDDCEVMSRWRDEGGVNLLRKVVSELQALLDNPGDVWVSVAECARILKKSEETIRRWCRDDTAWFRFQKQDNGEYAIWLPDLLRGDK